MAALITFLIILVVSTLVIRVATVALTLTGISRDVARFQALSAFTGVGYTTTEAEDIINHPARRQIIAVVIRLGNLGLVTTVASLLLTFAGTADRDEQLLRLAVLIVSVGVLGLVGSSDWLDRQLSRVIQWALRRWTDLEVRDYAAMLNLTNGYRVDEMLVRADLWVANKSLAESRLRQEGINVLGIYREDGTYIGAPHGQTHIYPGDRLIVYGQAADLGDLDDRLSGAAGDAKHDQAVADQEKLVRQQEETDAHS